MSDTDNFYPHCDLSIWLRNCYEEVRKSIEGKIILGDIPNWLSGTLLQNGPGGTNIYNQNHSENEKSSCQHLFDCPGLLQKIQFSNGRATYMNRFIQTKSHKRNLKAGRLVLNEFGTFATLDPCQTIFQRISAIFTNQLENTMTDTANISVQSFGDEIYSLSESPFAHRIELETLDTINTVNVNSEIGIVNHTAHPHIDKMTNKVYNIGQKIDLWNGLHYVIVEMEINNSSNHESTKSPWSQAKIVASIPSRWLLNICYMHSFSITDNYFILIEQPLSIFFPEIPINYILGKSKPIASCLKYFPQQNTIFHVIPRDSTKTRKTFQSSSLFFLHTINAFERQIILPPKSGKQNIESEIIIDVCTYNDPKMIDCMYIDTLRNAHSNPDYAKLFRGRPKRFCLHLSSDTKDDDEIVEGNTLIDFGCETPRINDNHNGKEYKYFYAISSDVDLDHPGLLVKVNTEMKTWETWRDESSYPSEPIFVPTPNGKTEDDGVILSTLLYGEEPNKISVIILDARKWELKTKIQFNTFGQIPKCLHGYFYDDKAVKVDRQ